MQAGPCCWNAKDWQPARSKTIRNSSHSPHSLAAPSDGICRAHRWRAEPRAALHAPRVALGANSSSTPCPAATTTRVQALSPSSTRGGQWKGVIQPLDPSVPQGTGPEDRTGPSRGVLADRALVRLRFRTAQSATSTAATQ